MNPNLSIMMLGLRGLPNVQGGVEAHVQNLASYLHELGCEVNVVVRTPYQPTEIQSPWHGIHIHRIWSPKKKSLEAIIHSILGVLYAAQKRPDILHIHAIGPSLVIPLARLLGLKVVVTHHGQDYARQKWGPFAKIVLMLGERFGMTMSQQRIVISHGLQDWVKKKFNRNSTLIPNGVLLPEMVESDGALQEFSLTKQRYVLTVSRLVPEKRHLDLINAFLMANLPDWKLVIVGGSDHPDDYTRELHELANQHANVVMTGVQKGLALKELFVHAGCFVLASSHEGLPIALLEALSYGLPCIASDIPANLEVELPENHYYNLGDVQALAKLLEEFSQHEHSDEEKKELRQWVTTSYNWKDISQQTLAVYQSILNP